MTEFFSSLLDIAAVVFAVAGMLSVGLGHSIEQIFAPLRRVGPVIRALLANFVFVPLLAFLILRLLSLETPVAAGLELVSLAAGAPFLVKLAEAAETDVGRSASLLLVLLPVTIVYLPFVVPRVAPGVDVSAWAIARPLLLSMLVPLAVGLALRAIAGNRPTRFRAFLARLSTIALIVLVISTVLANLRGILGMLRPGPLAAAVILVVGAFGVGYLLGTTSRAAREVLGLGTAQRNIAAATVVATQTLNDPTIVSMVVLTSLVGLAVLFPLAALLRKHGWKPEAENQQQRPERKESMATHRPNILVLCMDQWDTHMDVPADVRFPAMERLQAQGVSFDRYYCTVPICTPSRGSMWTGVHAKEAGLWDNTNFAWIHELSTDIPTIGHMLRDLGYYTAFKGKWHCSDVPLSEDALERYGFSDLQQWGEMFGTPLQGAMLDGTAVSETIDWLEHKRPQLSQPWMLVCSLINPHDIMYLQTDPVEAPVPGGFLVGRQSHVQRLSWFQKQWDVKLPANFEDDLRLQPFGVRHYKELIDRNYGRIPDDRSDLWLVRRNYLINAMRLVDNEFRRVLDTLDRLDLWKDTVVIFTSDHGEMNGAHRMAQKGAITFDEAAIVNFTVCAPDGPRGMRTAAVGSHLDLAPTILAFAGLSDDEIRTRYPHLKGRSLRDVILDPMQPGPRGSADAPGDGALFCWDGLHSLDCEWATAGALVVLTDLRFEQADPKEAWQSRVESLREAGRQYGAPDFTHRTFFRCIVDGQYKFVRWFSPQEYGNPTTLDELYATSDVALYDLVHDSGELDNIGHRGHPKHDPALIEHMLKKLHRLVREEIGQDHAPFDLDLFGTREVRYRKRKSRLAAD